jgi:hypothetical protein
MDLANLTLSINIGSGGAVTATTPIATLVASIITAITIATAVITTPRSAIITTCRVAVIISRVAVATTYTAPATVRATVRATTTRRRVATLRRGPTTGALLTVTTGQVCRGDKSAIFFDAIAHVIGGQLIIELIQGGAMISIDGGDERIVLSLVKAME